MRSRRQVLGTIGLMVATSSQPTLADVVERDRHPSERHDDTEAERSWPVPVAGPIDMSDFVAGPASVIVTSAGLLPAGGMSAGSLTVMVRELGAVGDVFHPTDIELALETEGMGFVGTQTASSNIPCKASRVSSDRRRVSIANPSRGRRVPWTVTLGGLRLAADRELRTGSVVRLEIAISSPQRLTRRGPVGSPGTVRE